MVAALVGQLRPDLVLPVTFVALLVVEVAGFWAGRRIGAEHTEDATAALTTALAAVFSIVALVLSFSFSFSLTRFEQRRQLVVLEANAIGTTYLRASVLPSRQAEQLRDLLRRYIAVRIDDYRNDANPLIQQRDEIDSEALQNRAFALVSDAVRANRQDLGASLLMQTTNDMLDVATEQRAALSFRFGGLALIAIVFVTAIGALALGVAFGYGNLRSWFIALLFALLLGWLAFTIVDLDTPQAGFARVNLVPLYEQQQGMIPASNQAPR